MAIYPKAIWKGPIPASNYSTNPGPKIGGVVHVIVGSANSAIGEFQSSGAQLSAHFVVSGAGDPYPDGTIFQLLDTNDCCYAQAAGNYPPTAYIAVEFSGQPTAAMTTGQILSGAAIFAWASQEHGFPLYGPVVHGAPGITGHCNPDGSADPNWGNHSCPGTIRLAQIPQIVYLAAVSINPTPPPAPKVSSNMATNVPTGGTLAVRPSGAVYAYPPATYYGSPLQVDPTKLPGGANSFVPVAPVVGIASTKTGNGYWLVAEDGGVFSFGDAEYHGSVAANPSWIKPVVGIALDPTHANGYTIVSDNGGPEPATYNCNEVNHYA